LFFAPITPNVIGSIGKIHGVKLVKRPPIKASKSDKNIFSEKSLPVFPVTSDSDVSAKENCPR